MSTDRRGASITYAEIDGIPICIVGGNLCEREAGHEGPHVFRNAGPWIETAAWDRAVVSPREGTQHG